MEQVTAFRTEDGKVFEKELDAKKHEFEEKFNAIVRDCTFGGETCPDDLLDKMIEEKLIKYPGGKR